MVFVVTGVEEGTALMIPKMRLGGQRTTRPSHHTPAGRAATKTCSWCPPPGPAAAALAPEARPARRTRLQPPLKSLRGAPAAPDSPRCRNTRARPAAWARASSGGPLEAAASESGRRARDRPIACGRRASTRRQGVGERRDVLCRAGQGRAAAAAQRWRVDVARESARRRPAGRLACATSLHRCRGGLRISADAALDCHAAVCAQA